MSRVVIIGGSGHVGTYHPAAAGFRRIRGCFRQPRTAASRTSRMATGSLYAPLLCLAELGRMPAPSTGKSVKCGPISSST